MEEDDSFRQIVQQYQNAPSMIELWQCLEILRNRRKCLFLRKNREYDRLLALNQISQLGRLNTIQLLIPFLKDHNSDVRQKTYSIIFDLFQKFHTKNDAAALRHCEVTTQDIVYYQREFSKEQFVTLLIILTFNKNGYLREVAVTRLGESGDRRAIPFLIYRLSDWVQQVRRVALESLRIFKKPSFLDELVANVVLFKSLCKTTRVDLSPVVSEIMDYLIVENGQFIRRYFKTFDDKHRLIVAMQIAGATRLQTGDLEMLLEDRFYLIRNLVLLHFDALSQENIRKLLRDKSSKVRIGILYRLKNSPDFFTTVATFIADDSAAIREFARFTLSGAKIDFPALYKENLVAGQNIIGSLCGICETNGKQFVDIVENYLYHEISKVRKCAFLALSNLDVAKGYNYAIRHLNTGGPQLMKAIMLFLVKNWTNEVVELAREIFAVNTEVDVRLRMLALLEKTGRWTAITDIMSATTDADAKIRQQSVNYLEKWIRSSNSYFLEPGLDELKRAKDVYRQAYTLHEWRKYFPKNPLEGLNFYLN